MSFALRQSGIHIRQIPHARVTTITYIIPFSSIGNKLLASASEAADSFVVAAAAAGAAASNLGELSPLLAYVESNKT